MILCEALWFVVPWWLSGLTRHHALNIWFQHILLLNAAALHNSICFSEQHAVVLNSLTGFSLLHTINCNYKHGFTLPLLHNKRKTFSFKKYKRKMQKVKMTLSSAFAPPSVKSNVWYLLNCQCKENWINTGSF